MKPQKPFRFWLLLPLLVPALLVVWFRTSHLNPTTNPLAEETATVPASKPLKAELELMAQENPVASKREMTLEEVATRFAARMTDWEMAGNVESDEIEAELKAMLNRTNAAIILKSLPEKFQATHLGLLALERWASVDRKAAAEWLAANPGTTGFQIATVTRDWLVQGDEPLYNYALNLPAGAWRDSLLGAMTQETLYTEDPELAFSLAAAMSPGPGQLRLLQASVLKWSEWDPQAALAQINHFPDASLQEKLIPSVAIGYAQNYPAESADWLLQSLPPGEGLNTGLATVIQIWAGKQNSAGIAKWLASLSESDTKARAQAALAAISKEPSANQQVYMETLTAPDSPRRSN